MVASNSHDTVQITVRLFSVLRHRDGKIVDRLSLNLPAGSRVSDVLDLLHVSEELESACALNGELVDEAMPLAKGDILSIIPAVAGG
jgi:molybdopterin converting factor small subunit